MLVLAACGETSSSGSTSTPAASLGPATAQLNLSGDASLAGPMSIIDVECNEPALSGPTITITAVPNGQQASGLQSTILISDGSVKVNIGRGGGATLIERQFKGTGTNHFNAAVGVQLSGAVIDDTDPSLNKSTIGDVTAVSGSVSCGNQTLGTSTVTLTGSTADGSINLSTTNFRVGCRTGSSGTFVGIAGIAVVNGVHTLWFVTIGPGSLQVAQEPETGATHFYLGQNQAGSIVTTTGGQVDSDAIENGKNGPPQYTVHAKGAATCGSSGKY